VTPAVLKAWRTYVRRWEGVCRWMYLDTKGKVTTGVGFLIDSIQAAQALPWAVRSTGHPASPAEIAQEWRRVHTMQDKKHLNGLNAVWVNSSRLRISDDTIDRQLDKMTPDYFNGVKRTLTDLDSFPADAQLALLDEAWQNGKAFLEVKNNGLFVWAGTRSALLSRNFHAAATHVPGSGPRHDFRARLFNNAAIVQSAGLDPTRLWDTDTPVVPLSKEGFDMATAKDLYKRGTVDQPISANVDTFVAVDDGPKKDGKDRGVSPVVGTNAGVDARFVVTFDAPTAVNVQLWSCLIDVGPAKGSSDDKDRANRVHGWQSFPAGKNWEIATGYKGKVPGPGAPNRNHRLRFRIRATAPITVTNSEVTGWEMP